MLQGMAPLISLTLLLANVVRVVDAMNTHSEAGVDAPSRVKVFDAASDKTVANPQYTPAAYNWSPSSEGIEVHAIA